MTAYADFLAAKTSGVPDHGITVTADDVNPYLHDWQRELVAWAAGRGRAAKNRDSSMTRPALADYLLLFRKPGDNATPIKNDVTNEEWIEWAQPVWMDIRETNTLNERVARDEADERHICPLQLDFIERVVRLWSNPDEVVLSPFAGIGSEIHTAVRLGRRGHGIELKPSYWRTAVNNLRDLDEQMNLPALFDEAAL